MAHVIEEAKSGRASCRSCKKPIAKGDLRLGEEVPNAFAAGEVTHQWHHLACAATKKPLVLESALASTSLVIPDRAALEATLVQKKAAQPTTTYPFCERAKTSRSSCIGCGEGIEKGTLRVAVEREVDTGTFVTTGAGYLHAACAAAWLAEHAPVDGALIAVLQKNTPTLTPGDTAALALELGE